MTGNWQALAQMLARISREIERLEQQNDPQYNEALAALRARHQALVRRLAGSGLKVDDYKMSVDELLVQATCAVLADGQIVGTAWLAHLEGYLLSAGHVLGIEAPASQVEIQFAGDVVRQAERVESMYDAKLGLDFAILKLIGSTSRRPLPISLAKTASGTFRLCGYGTGMKEQAQASSKGEFLGSVHLDNRPSRRLFRLYSPDLGQQGYSGGAVFSDELQAVVGIQTEASVRRVGPESHVVLAMPLYRVAPWWEMLHQLARSSANRQKPLSAKAGLVQKQPISAGIYIGGKAEGNTIVQGDNNVLNSPHAQTGGTRIGHIDASKVTVGADIQGGVPERLGQLAREILDGKITIQQIKGQDVVVGLRHITNPVQPTLSELRQGVATLRRQLETAIQAGQFTDQAAAEDALDDLDRVQKELAKPKPNSGRVIRKLESATNLLINSESAGIAGDTVTSLSADAAVLMKLTQKFFAM